MTPAEMQQVALSKSLLGPLEPKTLHSPATLSRHGGGRETAAMVTVSPLPPLPPAGISQSPQFQVGVGKSSTTTPRKIGERQPPTSDVQPLAASPHRTGKPLLCLKSWSNATAGQAQAIRRQRDQGWLQIFKRFGNTETPVLKHCPTELGKGWRDINSSKKGALLFIDGSQC